MEESRGKGGEVSLEEKRVPPGCTLVPSASKTHHLGRGFQEVS